VPRDLPVLQVPQVLQVPLDHEDLRVDSVIKDLRGRREAPVKSVLPDTPDIRVQRDIQVRRAGAVRLDTRDIRDIPARQVRPAPQVHRV